MRCYSYGVGVTAPKGRGVMNEGLHVTTLALVVLHVTPLLTANLHVKGTTTLGDGTESTTVDGPLTVTGDVVLGDTASDSTTISGKA